MATPKEYITSILEAIKKIAVLKEEHPLNFILSHEADMLMEELDTAAWATLDALKEIIEIEEE